MSTPSMVLFGAGVAACLAGVWSLAGLSERSSMRSTPRVVAAVAVGMVGLAAVYQRTPAQLGGQLLLPGLFGVVTVLALGAGAAKLEAALADRDGPRATRRSVGLIAGTFLGMGSIALVSLELLLSSVSHARFGWAYMLPAVAAALVVFAQRARLAGAGAIALGRRGLVLGLAGLALVVAARVMVTPAAASSAPAVLPRAELPPVASDAPPAVAPAPSELSAAAVPQPSAAPAPEGSSAAVTASAAPSALAPAPPGELQVEIVTTRGMLEADARGGVARRMSKLQACLDDAANQQSGALSLKIGIDAAGSVSYSKATGGDLVGTPLGACWLPVFYKMGFAAPASSSAHFEITLRTPQR